MIENAPEPAQMAAPVAGAAEVPAPVIPDWIPRGRRILGLADINFTGQVRYNNRCCAIYSYII